MTGYAPEVTSTASDVSTEPDVSTAPEVTSTPYVAHTVAAGLHVRGTVIVIPGRGENAAVYTRLATRLTVDAYRVAVLDDPAVTPEALAALVREQGSDGHSPVVVIGSDTGALAALALAARADTGNGTPREAEASTPGAPGLPLDGVVLAGLPTPGPPTPGPGIDPVSGHWIEELDARTACPVHRARLEADASLQRGALLNQPVDPWTANRPSVPALVLHGATDTISPLDEVRARLAGAVQKLVVVENGRHDVLNDVHHRSVAAEIVQFLEALRRNPLARPLLSEVTS